ncbi:hypothetical protein SAY87_022894 [Trapa incisa]|uniref:Uncharacterized protein n=1 Tax=Trapa incisa TaxID=236973 RepID=A0AAN7K1L3_9MYRT|nr:hypothetical protein SAY87_022894 [Trapa incisa]
MGKFAELDSVCAEDEGSFWAALDEATDPQNSGAIVRFAYFFGASVVLLCARNSAPSSGTSFGTARNDEVLGILSRKSGELLEDQSHQDRFL